VKFEKEVEERETELAKEAKK